MADPGDTAEEIIIERELKIEPEPEPESESEPELEPESKPGQKVTITYQKDPDEGRLKAIVDYGNNEIFGPSELGRYVFDSIISFLRDSGILDFVGRKYKNRPNLEIGYKSDFAEEDYYSRSPIVNCMNSEGDDPTLVDVNMRGNYFYGFDYDYPIIYGDFITYGTSRLSKEEYSNLQRGSFVYSYIDYSKKDIKFTGLNIGVINMEEFIDLPEEEVKEEIPQKVVSEPGGRKTYQKSVPLGLLAYHLDDFINILAVCGESMSDKRMFALEDVIQNYIENDVSLSQFVREVNSNLENGYINMDEKGRVWYNKKGVVKGFDQYISPDTSGAIDIKEMEDVEIDNYEEFWSNLVGRVEEGFEEPLFALRQKIDLDSVLGLSSIERSNYIISLIVPNYDYISRAFVNSYDVIRYLTTYIKYTWPIREVIIEYNRTKDSYTDESNVRLKREVDRLEGKVYKLMDNAYGNYFVIIDTLKKYLKESGKEPKGLSEHMKIMDNIYNIEKLGNVKIELDIYLSDKIKLRGDR